MEQKRTDHTMNPYFWKEFSSIQESVCSQLKVDQLSETARNYIIEMVGTIEAMVGKGFIDSVILFGSLSYDNPTKISDVDLLVILNNNIPYSKIRGMEGVLKSIEIKYGYAQFPRNLITKILRAVEKTTGMFCSHFVCLRKDWDNNNFARIFSTFKPFTYLLAPDKVVLDSMKNGSCLLYGNAPIDMQKSQYNQ